jgi:hypothetical protein
MTKVRIDKRGLVTTGPPEDPTTLNVDHFANTKNKLLSADVNGKVTPVTVASGSRFEYYEHGGGEQIISASDGFLPVQIDGAMDSFNGGLTGWNTSSNVFQPEEVNSIYTLRFAGEVVPVGGNPIYHLDFVVSGSDPDQVVGFRHHQSIEQTIRNTADHIHIHGVFVVFVDQDLFVSGGQFKMHTESTTLTLASASVLIKEG